jgi:hypothetical protein
MSGLWEKAQILRSSTKFENTVFALIPKQNATMYIYFETALQFRLSTELY